MTRAEIKLNILRTRVVALENYGYHVFLWHGNKRDDARVRP